MKIKSGYGTNMLPLWAVFNLYVIYICTSIPGLAISPIMGDLTRIFPGTSALESQMLEIGPNIAAIPFVFLGGWIGTKFNNNKLTTWTCVFYGICGILFFFVPNMICLIILSFLIGIAAGILSPLASAFIADMFGGKERTAQFGYTSATLNLVLMFCTIATGYLAKVSWRLPFIIYLLPIVPLFFAKGFKKYITDPTQIRQKDAAANAGQKVHYKFSEQVNMGMLIRYCIYYFVITFVIAAISLYLPFRYTNSSTAGDLTSILFFGIMLSGYTLNWALRWMKKNVAIIVLIATVAGFLLMSITSEVVLVGLGILIATYFYGIAQPYYYERLSTASSRIALTLTLAWFAAMDSIGNVVAAPVIDGISDLLHHSTDKYPYMAFYICTALSIVALVVVIVRKMIVGIKDHNEENKMNMTIANPTTPALHSAGVGVATSETHSASIPTSIPSVTSSATNPVSATDSSADDAQEQISARSSAEAAAEAANRVAADTLAAAKEARAEADKADAEARSADEKASEAEAAAKAAQEVAEAAKNVANSIGIDENQPDKTNNSPA